MWTNTLIDLHEMRCIRLMFNSLCRHMRTSLVNRWTSYGIDNPASQPSIWPNRINRLPNQHCSRSSHLSTSTQPYNIKAAQWLHPLFIHIFLKKTKTFCLLCQTWKHFLWRRRSEHISNQIENKQMRHTANINIFVSIYFLFYRKEAKIDTYSIFPCLSSIL